MTMLVRGGAAAGSSLPNTATTGQVLQWNGSAWVAATPSASGTTPNATTAVPGLIQLAGDLAGTATAPTVAKINGAAPAAVATSGAYTDLTGRPALATVATTGSYGDLTGRPALATVATSGSYGDLTGRPALATVATTGSYGDLTGRPLLATVATSGSYTDLANTPSVTSVQTAYKTAGSDYSSTTKASDPHLQFASVPVGTYLFEMGGTHTAASSSALVWLVAGTAAFTGTAKGQQIYALTAASSPTGTVVTAAAGGSITNSGATAVCGFAVPLTVTTAGSLGLSIGSSNGTLITLNAGTWARLTKVA